MQSYPFPAQQPRATSHPLKSNTPIARCFPADSVAVSLLRDQLCRPRQYRLRQAAVHARPRFHGVKYGLGAGFFIGYVLFEVPSNLWMQRVGARRTLLRMHVRVGTRVEPHDVRATPTQFYAMRFVLGVTEAGFFPGIIYYLGLVSRREARSRHRIPDDGDGGGGHHRRPDVGVHQDAARRRRRLARLEWLFLLEGVLAVTLGSHRVPRVRRTAGDVNWLSDREKALVSRELAADETTKRTGRLDGLRGALANPRVYFAALVYFAVMIPSNAIAFWAPTIIRDLGVASVWMWDLSALAVDCGCDRYFRSGGEFRPDDGAPLAHRGQRL